MRESRNPFRLRRSESIDTDTAFLSLFEPGILEVLAHPGLPVTVQPIRSAAGGGKTSLLRLFTPSVLLGLHSRRGDENVKDLCSKLTSLEVLDDRGPRLLGVMLLCGRNYAVLQDLPIDDATRTRLFFGLLNARILLAVLRSALALRGLRYPDDLGSLVVAPPEELDLPTDLALPCTGNSLYEWARRLEKSICSELDSFGPLKATSLPGHDDLFALRIARPEAITLNGAPLAERMVIMMDDIHMLTPQQRSLLVERVIEARSSVGVWIAERFEALSTPEMLASGATENRDRTVSVEIEPYWRKYYERFEKHVMHVADRRVWESAETERHEFRSCLESNIDGREYEELLEQAVVDVSARVRRRRDQSGRFHDWVQSREGMTGSLHERAIGWRALEILIEREIRRPQKTLFEVVADRDGDGLDQKDDSRVKQAAELFLAREYQLPYYYGPERIARLASLNIEQFLGIAGSVFEEVIAAELLRGGTQTLSARRQHDLMKAAAQALWKDIPKKVRHGRSLQAFLGSVGTFSHWYTYDYRPTAPNDPGVGGTAIRMSERDMLLEAVSLAKRPERKRLADILASAMAHNYLVADLDYKCKGERWMVLNLNRLLCVHFDLPLGYGLYKERPLDELCRWITTPFAPPPRQDSLV